MDDSLTGMTDREAAAELLVMHYESLGVVIDVAADANVVSVTTGMNGVHRGNVAKDYDSNVHMVCEAEAVNSGPLSGNIHPDATVYWNEVVYGIADDFEGGALPTHRSKREGPVPKSPDELDDRVRSLAEQAGVYG